MVYHGQFVTWLISTIIIISRFSPGNSECGSFVHAKPSLLQCLYNYRHDTFAIDRQWLYDHAVKFARWQHHATGRGARFADMAPLVFNWFVLYA